MQWIRVEESLPRDGMRVLLLCKGFFGGIFKDDYLSQKPSFAIFEGKFHRNRGWHKFFCDDQSAIVMGWMPRPIDLQEDNEKR